MNIKVIGTILVIIIAIAVAVSVYYFYYLKNTSASINSKTFKLNLH